MKKLLTASVMSAALALAAWAPSANAENWDMPTPYPEGNYHTQNVMAFAKEVEELTGGDLTITVHSGASLFKMPEIKRAVRTRQAPIGEILLSAYGNENAVFEADGIPFLAAGFDNAMKLYKAQKPVLEEVLAEEGLMLLYTVPWPGQGLYSKTAVSSMGDMAGVKFRAYNAATSRLAELMGAIPTTVQYAEVPQAFSTGVVSAMLTSATTGVDTQSWDFLDYFYTTDAMHPKNAVFVNKDAFDALSEAQQKAVLTAAANAESRGWATARKAGDDAASTLSSNGMNVEAPGDQLKAEFSKIGETMTAEWLEKAGANGQKIVDAYKAM
ncbi:TRAP transporter substrate-binding protein [Hwanghaeella sp.]|uniref:TRAP transporter substrate-binding protein n=1 Tax=Hwanghaeella sp. TaxID=2605943 RepID=UPI003CCC0147